MLQISQLCKSFDGRLVLDHVDLELERGKTGVLIGPSGSGKSTLLRCVNGLADFQSGRITVAGHELRGDDRPASRQKTLLALRRQVGMVFQQFHLFPHMTVLQNLITAPQSVLGLKRDAAVDIARPLLQRMGLQTFEDRYPATLSGGQQQRVAIARALAMKPQLILFDEPTSALDPKMAAEVLTVMNDLAAAGETMLVVTHAMGFAKRAAHVVYVMDTGRIVEHGPPAALFSNPQHAATQSLLARTELE